LGNDIPDTKHPEVKAVGIGDISELEMFTKSGFLRV
jgi:hypothetical protein